MSARTTALIAMLFLGFWSQAVSATDDGPDWVGGDIEKACIASYDLCLLSCQGNAACGGKCTLTLNDCLNSTDGEFDVEPEQSQHSGAPIRTGAGLCLDVHAPDMGNNGGRVQAWTCHGAPQQTWTYDRAARAVRVASGLCLDVHAPQMTTNGGRVQVWTCNGSPQQQWTPANGSLRNAGGLCLDVHAPDQATNGARVQVWQCNGSQQQRFTSSAFGTWRSRRR
jgi:hypothetical protein